MQDREPDIGRSKDSRKGAEIMAKVKAKYRYGMRLRGFSIGCQPMDGLVSVLDDKYGIYHDIIVYDRMLTGTEVADYELTYLGKAE